MKLTKWLQITRHFPSLKNKEGRVKKKREREGRRERKRESERPAEVPITLSDSASILP